MVDFVEALTANLALATAGVSPEGLRIGLTWFACSNGVPVTRKFVSPASGDPTVLRDAFAKLQSIKPAGGTCPSEGLMGIRDDILATAEMIRPKAVLLMTDGLIEEKDSSKALQFGNQIRNAGAMFFTLSVGSKNLKAAEKEQQLTQLTSLSGGERDRMFAADDAASLPQVVAILSSLTFNTFHASFTPNVMETNFCFKDEARVILTGPSVDYIVFGVDYFLHCNFGGSAAEETVATRNAQGVLSCPVPSDAFPISVVRNSDANMVTRNLQISLVLVASNGERRALKFSQKLSLLLGQECFHPVLAHDCLKDQEAMAFSLVGATTEAKDVYCQFSFQVESVRTTALAASSQLLRGDAVDAIMIGNQGQYMCQINQHAGQVAFVDVHYGQAGNAIMSYPIATTAESCFRPLLAFDGNGCYGSNLLFTFEGKNMSNSACYFYATEGRGMYEPLRMENEACLLPVRLQRTEGEVIVATADEQGLIRFQRSYSGEPPAFSQNSECVRLQAVLGAGGCEHLGEKDIIRLQFASPTTLEGFSCDYANGESTALRAVDGNTWACEYRAERLTIAKRGWVAATFSTIPVPASTVCASFFMDQLDLCWGKPATITVQGESLNGATGLLECTMTYLDKQYSAPLVFVTDTKATCDLPLVHGSIGSGAMTLGLIKTSDLSRTPLVSNTFPRISLSSCTRVSMTEAANGSSNNSSAVVLDCQNVYVDAALLQSAKAFGLGDLSCEFSNNDGTKLVSKPLTTKQCALPMFASTKLRLVGRVGASAITFGEFDLDVTRCALRASTSKPAVCYGDVASISIEYDVVSYRQYECHFSNPSHGTTKAVSLPGALLCSYAFYGPEDDLKVSISSPAIPASKSPSVSIASLFALDTSSTRCVVVKPAPTCDASFRREITLAGSVLETIINEEKLGALTCQFSAADDLGEVVLAPVQLTSTGSVTCISPVMASKPLHLTLLLDKSQIIYVAADKISACQTLKPTTGRPTTRSPSFRPSATPTAKPYLKTDVPTASPHSSTPTASPQSSAPTASPTRLPTASPTHLPTASPTYLPSASPTLSPTEATEEPEIEFVISTSSPSTNASDPLLSQVPVPLASNSQVGEAVGGTFAALILLALLALCLCCKTHRRNRSVNGTGSVVVIKTADNDVEKQTPQKKNARFKLKQSPAVTNVMPVALRMNNAFAQQEEDEVSPSEEIVETMDLDPKRFQLTEYLKSSLLPAALFQSSTPPPHHASAAAGPMDLVNISQVNLEEAMTEVSLIGPDLVRVVIHHNGHREGLGLSLGRTADGTLLVDAFLRSGRTTAGPLEACGAVWVGDALIEINDVNVQGWSLKDCANVIRKQRALKGLTEISFIFKTKNRNLLLGYGAYQVTVPRGLVDLGLVFERTDRLVVVHKNKLAPLRNIVTLGSRLTAVDGVPVASMQELRARTSLDAYFNVPTVRLRFESPTNPIALRAAKVGGSFRESRTTTTTTMTAPADIPDDAAYML